METNIDNVTEKPVAAKKSAKRYIAFVIKLVLTAIIIYFVGRQLVKNWSEIAHYDWEINPLLIVLSIVFHLTTFVFFSGMWCILIRAFGYNVPFKYAFKISYIADLGRYIPGKVWSVFGMVYFLNKINVKKEVAFASWGVALILGFLPGFAVVFIALSFHPEMMPEALRGNIGVLPYIAMVVTVLITILLALMPEKSMLIFNWFLKLLKRPQIEFKLKKKVALIILIGYFIGWVFYGLGFYTFINAIMVKPPLPVVAGVGSFAMAYLIGYMTFFTPGGLGARELVLTAVLTPFLGPVAAGAAVAARLWNMVSELIAALIALSIKMEGKRT